jgi:methionyl-tRNA synthetase
MNKYLTTTLPYVNADPHIGFALELVQADALVRTWRLQGDDVFFTTGTDEHGQKIFEAAEKAGLDVHAYVDEFAGKVKGLKDTLDLSLSTFIRTTEPRHYTAAQEMWRRCETAGDIYKKAYTGMYCVGCEEYKTERELTEDGHCLLHPSLMIEEITEENYFFKFSKYEDKLREYIARPGVIVPEWRRGEAEAFVNGGLHDFSISREKEKLSWGIPVPGDDSQVMYVWFDALINYISTLGWPEDVEGNFEKFWTGGETLQVAGKDQVRFQSLMWQAMLMSADLKPTDSVFYHGFINSGGQKMSKSVGNVISPYDLVEKYGTDATRYLLLRHVHPVDDSDVTWERLDEWYTANLVNGLGNLVARVMKLAEGQFDEPVQLESGDTEIDAEFPSRITEFRFNEAADFIFDMIAECDALMTGREPFKKIKSEAEGVREEGKADIALLVRHLAKIATHLSPLMPETSVKILEAVQENKKPENLFPRLAS